MGIKWIKLDSVASTNSYLTELIRVGEGNDDLVVTAEYQTNGRGLGSHSWQSKKGENLLMSILLHPAFLSASEQFQISRLTSLAICDVLESMKLDTFIKWPNDILTVRGKIAGIRIELGISGGSISHAILGIGINLNQLVFPSFSVQATSVIKEKGNAVDPIHIADQLMKRIVTRYNKLKEGSEEGLEGEYLDRMFMKDQHAYFLIRGVQYPGMIRGVTNLGELQVELGGKIQTFGHQEIECLIPSA